LGSAGSSTNASKFDGNNSSEDESETQTSGKFTYYTNLEELD